MKECYIIVHGFGGNPNDVQSIANEIIKKGIQSENVYMPLLKGHHMKKRGIDIGTTYIQMVDGLKKYIKNLKNNYSKLIVIGYSMGALISMEIATEMGVDKLILINPPMKVWHFRNFIHTLRTSKFDRKKYHIKTVLSSLSYKKILNNVELTKLQKNINRNMYKIYTDTLIIKSKYDYVARPNSAIKVYDGISSKNKQIIEYESPSHFIPNEDNLPKIVDDMFKWINAIEV